MREGSDSSILRIGLIIGKSFLYGYLYGVDFERHLDVTRFMVTTHHFLWQALLGIRSVRLSRASNINAI
jgi:hypothetical protein